MDLTFALVQLALLISSSTCRNIELTEPELIQSAFNHDFVITNFAEQLFVPESSMEVNENQLNKLKKRLKVVPFKGNKTWKSKDDKVLGQDFGKNTDVPIAVIFASKDNVIDNKDKKSVETLGKEVNKLPKSYNRSYVNKKIDENTFMTKDEIKYTVPNASMVTLKNETRVLNNLNATETSVDNEHIEQKKLNEKTLKANENLKEIKLEIENDTQDISESKKQVDVHSDKDLPINEVNTFLNGINVNVSKVDVISPANELKINDSEPINVLNEEVVEIKEKYITNFNETKPSNHHNFKPLCKIFNFTEDGLIKHNHYNIKFVFN